MLLLHLNFFKFYFLTFTGFVSTYDHFYNQLVGINTALWSPFIITTIHSLREKPRKSCVTLLSFLAEFKSSRHPFNFYLFSLIFFFLVCCLLLSATLLDFLSFLDMENLLGLLRIHVHRGVNLAIRDVMSSDPYVVVRMGKQVIKFSFPVSPAIFFNFCDLCFSSFSFSFSF